jgi:hypothetical protein
MKLAFLIGVCILGLGFGVWLAYKEPQVLKKIVVDVGEELLVDTVEALA